MAGLWLARVLPGHHLSSESRETVKLAIGTVATLAALILGLLIASAKGGYDLKDHEYRAAMANLVLLDRVLRQYGPEADEARTILKNSVVALANRQGRTINVKTVWTDLSASSNIEKIQNILRGLTPASDGEKWLQGRALELTGDIAQSRWLLVEQSGSALQTPFLIILIFWLVVIFVSFGMFAPRNATVIVAFMLCSLSVASAVFLLMELDQPFGGLIHISEAPLREAVELLTMDAPHGDASTAP